MSQVIRFESRQFSASWLDEVRKRRMLLLTVFVTLLSLGLARLILAFDVAVVGGLVVCIATCAIIARPRYGVYLVFAAVLLFEASSGEDPLMLPGLYLNRSLQESLHLTGAIFFPIEVLLLLVGVAWLAGAAVRRRLDFQPGAFGRPALFFGLAIAFGMVRGLVAGGTFNYAFWESRFLVGMLLAYILTTNTIRTRAHILTLSTVVMVCVSLSGIEAIWRRFALANTGLLGPAQETWYSHDDVVIWGLLVMLVLGQQVFGGPRWQRILGPLVGLAAVVAMLVSERRAGYFAVLVAFLAFTAMLLVVKRKAFVLLAVPLLLAGAVYLPLFWNNTGTLGQPARAIRSMSSPDQRDASSNAWRDLEAINVRATITSDPLLGVGFGQPFLQVVPVPDISFFEFWNYESHHDILWVWMKTGGLGFIAFFALLISGVARSAWLIKRLKDPELKTFAIVGMSAILLSVTFCYVDLGLTTSRIPIVLGVALGAVGVLDRPRNQGDAIFIKRGTKT